MYTAKIQNAQGDIMALTGNEAAYQVIDIAGLNPPQAEINTTTIVGMDGARFNSIKLETRNIVITIRINGDVEANRKNLYRFFRTKEICTFYYKNSNFDVSIQGYVQSFECGFFSDSETAQISIICPQPYFRSIEEIVSDFSNTVAAFTFPFTINSGSPVIISEYSTAGVEVYNDSEAETGAMIELAFHDSVGKVELKNTTTGDDMILQYSFLDGDTVLINTNKGEKSITLIRNGVLSNLFSAMAQGSVFFQIASGENAFEYLVDNDSSASIMEKLTVTFRFHNLYRGV